MTYHDGVCFPLEMRRPIVVEQPERSGTFVRLSEDVRTSVVYLGHKSDADGEIDPIGTGFLVKVGAVHRTRYLVTAAHVALELEDQPFYVRMNQHTSSDGAKGQGRLHRIDHARWFYHPSDPTVDVAVMQFEAPQWADVLWWPLGSFLSEYKLATKNIGAGDLSYVVGILPYMKGKKRNMPAVHSGHVILMPDDGETVTISDWRQQPLNRGSKEKKRQMEIEAYLIQATALPGSSGSPVFVRRSLATKLDLPELDPRPIKVSIPGALWFLGIWRGAWFGNAPEPVGLSNDTKVPYGVGTVVPAIKLCEVIEQKELSDRRDEAQQAEADKTADTPLSAKAARGIAKAGDAILRAALNTPPPAQTAKPKAKAVKRGPGGVSSK